MGKHGPRIRADTRDSASLCRSPIYPAATSPAFRVTASDGVRTGSDTSDPILIPKHEPDVRIAGVFPGERIPFGSKRRLLAHAIDVEDGTEGVSTNWNGTIPPTTLDAVDLGSLPPGTHQAILTAIDRDGMSGMATLDFEILPPTIPEVKPVPQIDGHCSESAWTQARLIQIMSSGEPLNTLAYCIAEMRSTSPSRT